MDGGVVAVAMVDEAHLLIILQQDVHLLPPMR
jgi:hypothetical protein